MTESCNCADKIAALQLEAGLVEGYRLTQAELWAENRRLRAALTRIADQDNCDSECWGCKEWASSCSTTAADDWPCAPYVASAALGRSSDPTEETCN